MFIGCGEEKDQYISLRKILGSEGTNFSPTYNIILPPKLIYDRKASQQLDNFVKKFDSYEFHVKRCAELDERGEDFDKEEYKELVRIVVEYPYSTSALTAKLRIAKLLSWSRNTRKEALRLLEEIKREYPERWQAIYATYWIGHMKFDEVAWTEQTATVLPAVITYHLRHMEDYKKVDQEKDPEFHQLWKGRQPIFPNKPQRPDPLSSSVLSSIACWYDMFLDDPETAIKYCERIIKEYPETEAADQAQLRLDDYIQHLEWKKYREAYYQKNGCYPDFHETQQWRRDYDKKHSRKEEIEQIKQQKENSTPK